jgi:hypothetical protein
MTTDIESPEARIAGPDIHVWMTPEDAAQTLSTPVEDIERQLDEGDLDSRVNEDGMLEVSICLPKRTSAQPEMRLTLASESILSEPIIREATPPAMIGQTMLPLIQAMRHTRTGGDELRVARRSARRAWAMAAAILLAAGGVVGVSVNAAIGSRNVAADATQKLDQTSSQTAILINDKETLTASQETLRETNAELATKLMKLAADQDRLKSQLTEATDSLTKVQGDLVVERNVEDQLLQAALASHAAKGSPMKNQVVADGSN